jgi:hypothetical protein
MKHVELTHTTLNAIAIFNNKSLYLIIFRGVSVYLLHVLGVILTFLIILATSINFDLEPISTRTFTLTLSYFWPKLCSGSVPSPSHPHLHHTSHLFIFEARRALWAPRSVGPYGLGRAPSPLMHAPVGHAYGCPIGHPL